MKVGNRIRSLGAVGTAAMVILFVITLHYITSAKLKVDDVTKNVVPSYQVMLLIQQHFQTVRRDLLLHIMEQSPEKMASIHSKLEQGLAELDKQLGKYSKSVYDTKDQEILDATQKAVAAWKGPMDSTIKASTTLNKQEAMRLVEEVTGPLSDVVFKNISEMSGHYNGITGNANASIENSFSLLSKISIGISIVLITAIFVLSETITRSITRPLNALRDLVGNVAQTYDFTVRTTGIGNDEVGETQKSFNHLLGAIQDSLHKVRDIGHAVGKRAETVATASTELSSASNMVSESSEKIAAGTEQVTASVTHVADRTQEADECAREAGLYAQNGGMVIEDTITRINKIADHVRESSGQIESLVTRTESIGVVVNTIKEIADQTNLLALNAAIEAARAGETGRGFAVVADEVRKLAERTAGSTKEISTTVEAIQTEAEQTVFVMKNTVTEVEQGVAHAQEALSAITQIRDSTEEVKTQISDISSAMREQTVASNSMAQEIEKVAQMAEETNATARQTAESSSELNALAVDLNRIIGSYAI